MFGTYAPCRFSRCYHRWNEGLKVRIYSCRTSEKTSGRGTRVLSLRSANDFSRLTTFFDDLYRPLNLIRSSDTANGRVIVVAWFDLAITLETWHNGNRCAGRAKCDCIDGSIFVLLSGEANCCEHLSPALLQERHELGTLTGFALAKYLKPVDSGLHSSRSAW